MLCHQGWAIEADKKKEQEIRKQDKKRTGKKDEDDDLDEAAYHSYGVRVIAVLMIALHCQCASVDDCTEYTLGTWQGCAAEPYDRYIPDEVVARSIAGTTVTAAHCCSHCCSQSKTDEATVLDEEFRALPTSTLDAMYHEAELVKCRLSEVPVVTANLGCIKPGLGARPTWLG